MARRTEVLLDQEAVIAAAFAVLNERGLNQLTMRAVAERLSVHPPALYWHFRNKAELLGRMARAMNRDAGIEIDERADCGAWLEAYARRFAGILLSCRDGVQLGAVAQPLVESDIAERGRAIVEPLLARGMSESEAHAAIASVMAFTLGWATYLSNAPMAEQLRKLVDLDSTFERGLAALIDGLNLRSFTNPLSKAV